MYQSITTKVYQLSIPLYEGSEEDPVEASYLIPIDGCSRGGSILRLDMETDLVDRDVNFEVLTGLNSINPAIFPITADDAYLVTEGLIADGQYYSSYGLNELLYIMPGNMGSILSNKLYLRVTMSENGARAAATLRLKMETAVAVTT